MRPIATHPLSDPFARTALVIDSRADRAKALADRLSQLRRPSVESTRPRSIAPTS